MTENQTKDQNTVKNNDPENEIIYEYEGDDEWTYEMNQYRLAQRVANGDITLPTLRKSREYRNILDWIQQMMDTIEMIKIFERAGLTLSDDQVYVLHAAIFQRFLGNAKDGDYYMNKFFSAESRERIENLDFSKCNYDFFCKWQWLIDRKILQEGPDDSPAKVFLSKIRKELVSEELLAGEQEMITELQKVMPEISALMNRFYNVSE